MQNSELGVFLVTNEKTNFSLVSGRPFVVSGHSHVKILVSYVSFTALEIVLVRH